MYQTKVREKKNEYSSGDIAQGVSRWQAEVNVRTAGAYMTAKIVFANWNYLKIYEKWT